MSEAVVLVEVAPDLSSPLVLTVASVACLAGLYAMQLIIRFSHWTVLATQRVFTRYTLRRGSASPGAAGDPDAPDVTDPSEP